jgi:hypothetical protein
VLFTFYDFPAQTLAHFFELSVLSNAQTNFSENHRVIISRAVVPKRGRSFTGNWVECAVEMWQRLKTNVIRDFTDPQVRIEQEGFGFLDPHTAELFCKGQAGRLLERFAKVERRNVHGLCHIIQIDRIGLVPNDILARPSNQRRFGFHLLHHGGVHVRQTFPSEKAIIHVIDQQHDKIDEKLVLSGRRPVHAVPQRLPLGVDGPHVVAYQRVPIPSFRLLSHDHWPDPFEVKAGVPIPSLSFQLRLSLSADVRTCVRVHPVAAVHGPLEEIELKRLFKGAAKQVGPQAACRAQGLLRDRSWEKGGDHRQTLCGIRHAISCPGIQQIEREAGARGKRGQLGHQRSPVGAGALEHGERELDRQGVARSDTDNVLGKRIYLATLSGGPLAAS